MTSGAQYVPVRTRHLMHLVISCFTFGLWLPVWAIVAIYNHNRTVLRQLPQCPDPSYVPGYWPPYGVVQIGPPPHQPPHPEKPR
jgi:hypothetical protein